MNVDFAVELFRELLKTSLVVVMPILLIAMLVGIVISLLQALTSIQEQTLAFVPKLVAVIGLMMFLAYWFVEVMTTFTIEIFNRLPSVVGG
jgi:flagellar biosynthetic protein FliQ|tara:strand:- start:846 stop:1118 length:273 start_codon:yes stop_codon:yes gene_type:complete